MTNRFSYYSLILVLLFNTVFLIRSENKLELHKSFLKLPSGMEAAKIVLDEKGYFHMQIDENNTYTFKLEYIDAKLRYINLNELFFELGMMWNFQDSKTIFLASDILTEENMKPFATKLQSYEILSPEVDLALQSKPVGAYLNVFKLKNNEYGMQICPKEEELGSQESGCVIGVANLPPDFDHNNVPDPRYSSNNEEKKGKRGKKDKKEEEKGFIDSLIYDSLWK